MSSRKPRLDMQMRSVSVPTSRFPYGTRLSSITFLDPPVQPLANSEDDSESTETDPGQTESENISLKSHKLKQIKIIDSSRNATSCHCDCNSNPSCIHVLASTGEVESLQIALSKIKDDTVLNLFDKKGRTVLHCAADFRGFHEIALDCAKVILTHVLEILKNDLYKEEKVETFVNACDRKKFTALYLAAKRENADLCDVLIRCKADWDIRSWRGKSPAEKVFKKIPQLIVQLIEESSNRKNPECYYVDGERSTVCLDFGTITTYPSVSDVKSKRIGRYEELDYLSNICYTPLQHRMEILKQPLVKILIWKKWQKIKWFVLAARVFQIAWFLLYSVFLILVYRHDCPYQSDIQYKFNLWLNFEEPELRNDTGESHSNSENECQSNIGSILVWILLATLLLDLIFFQLPPIRVRWRRYWHPMNDRNFRKYYKRFLLFLRIIHAGKISFLCITFSTLYPVIIATIQDTSIKLAWDGWYILASIGIALTWFNILTQIGKIPKFRIYIKMLTTVLQTLGLVLLIYSSVIIAFAMVFCILLPGSAPYSSPLQAILKMSNFFIGEINYDETFYGETSKHITATQGWTMLVFGAAIVILNVALLNFVIGLTVADIQVKKAQLELRQYTSTWKNYSILWQIFLFDTFLSHFPIKSQDLLKKLMIFKPPKDDNETPDFKLEIVLKTLPKHLRKEVHKLNLRVGHRTPLSS